MHGEEIKENLQAYLDGQLSPAEARALKAHLEVCDACVAELNALREVDEALATMPVLPEPAGLTARIMAQIPAPPAPVFRLRWEDAVTQQTSPAVSRERSSPKKLRLNSGEWINTSNSSLVSRFLIFFGRKILPRLSIFTTIVNLTRHQRYTRNTS